jgi:hypothetical protein
MKAKLIQTQVNQSLFDIAIQEYGAAEGVFLVMMANRDVIESITDDIVPGTALKIWPVKVVRQLAEQTESLNAYLPVLMQWIALVSNGGSSGGGGLNDGDYVHIRGDEIVSGIKTFVNTIRTSEIEEITNEGVTVEGITFKDGVLDAGTF